MVACWLHSLQAEAALPKSRLINQRPLTLNIHSSI